MATETQQQNEAAAEDAKRPSTAPCYNPIKSATQIAIHHRRLIDAMTQQGPNEIAAAMDNLECAIQKARYDLGL